MSAQKIVVDPTLPPAQFNAALRTALHARRAFVQQNRQQPAEFDRELEVFARHGWTGQHAVEMAEAHRRIGGAL